MERKHHEDGAWSMSEKNDFQYFSSIEGNYVSSMKTLMWKKEGLKIFVQDSKV